MAPTGRFDERDLNAYTVIQLKDILRLMRLPITGSKSELITRLSTVDPAEWAAIPADLWQDSATGEEEEEAASSGMTEHRWTVSRRDIIQLNGENRNSFDEKGTC